MKTQHLFSFWMSQALPEAELKSTTEAVHSWPGKTSQELKFFWRAETLRETILCLARCYIMYFLHWMGVTWEYKAGDAKNDLDGHPPSMHATQFSMSRQRGNEICLLKTLHLHPISPLLSVSLPFANNSVTHTEYFSGSSCVCWKHKKWPLPCKSCL